MSHRSTPTAACPKAVSPGAIPALLLLNGGRSAPEALEGRNEEAPFRRRFRPVSTRAPAARLHRQQTEKTVENGRKPSREHNDLGVAGMTMPALRTLILPPDACPHARPAGEILEA
jgi:hypothetical protein